MSSQLDDQIDAVTAAFLRILSPGTSMVLRDLIARVEREQPEVSPDTVRYAFWHLLGRRLIERDGTTGLIRRR
jgi:hypothetical protein